MTTFGDYRHIRSSRICIKYGDENPLNLVTPPLQNGLEPGDGRSGLNVEDFVPQAVYGFFLQSFRVDEPLWVGASIRCSSEICARRIKGNVQTFERAANIGPYLGRGP